jgi:ribokinase
VYVVGSTNVDRSVRVPRLPAAGETALGDAVHVAPGGKGANAAVAAARCGAPVTFVSAAGADRDGDASIAALRAEGVDAGGVRRVPDMATGSALIITDAAGDNLIAVGAGANAGLRPQHLRDSLRALEATDALLVSAEIPDECVEAALRIGSERGAQVILDPAPARRSLLAWAGYGPILTPNRTEATSLAGCAEPAAAAKQLGALTGRPVIVTLGEAGCLVWRDNTITHHPAAPAQTVVDTVGAGDAFAGGLAAGLARGDGIEAAVAAALRAAAESLAHPGARPAGGRPGGVH